jgi:hypothetical protein
MESQEEWEIKLVRDRHRWLKLTPRQVRAVWEMEQKENRFRRGIEEHFTFWEEMDRDWDRWHAILKPEQFKLWENDHKKLLRDHEQMLMQEDAKNLKEIEFHQAYIGWLRKTFLPGLHKAIGKEAIMIRMDQEQKIGYLRAEFRTYILRQENNITISHYRHCRRLQPNGLRLSLLRNELWALLPDYSSFVREADDGVKAVARGVLENKKFHFAHHGELLLKEIRLTGEHHKSLREKFFGDVTPKGGWHSIIERKTDLTPGEEGWMGYLLMDTAPGTMLNWHQEYKKL